MFILLLLSRPHSHCWQAKTVVAPLDRIKILFQTSHPSYEPYKGHWTGVFRAISRIYRDGGAQGLFQGHSVTLLRVFPYAGIRFMTYDTAEALLMSTREEQTGFRYFFAGATSGMAICSLIMLPMTHRQG
jgi:solute carrier family 25 protein 16